MGRPGRHGRWTALAALLICAAAIGCGGNDGTSSGEGGSAEQTTAGVSTAALERCMADEGFPLAPFRDRFYSVYTDLDPVVAEQIRDDTTDELQTRDTLEFRNDPDVPFIDPTGGAAPLVLVFASDAAASSADSRMPKIALTGQTGNVAWSVVGGGQTRILPSAETREFAVAIRTCAS